MPLIRCRLVALGQRGIVEHGVDEVVERSAERHDCLSDVQQLAGAFPDNVDAQN